MLFTTSLIAFQTLLGVLSYLLDGRHAGGWSFSQPPGAVGEQFMGVVQDVVSLVAKSLRFHVQRGDIVPSSTDLVVRANVRNIGKLGNLGPNFYGVIYHCYYCITCHSYFICSITKRSFNHNTLFDVLISTTVF